MHIGLHDADSEHLKDKTFPNYALMKISAYHKARGDTVSWWNPLESEDFDKVYSSKIFDFTPENPYLLHSAIKGGTGYNVKSVLPSDIDAMTPDYSIYPACDYATGFLTRGCPNSCRWCLVPEKEGGIKPYRNWQELVRLDSNRLVLMDNNILACEHGIKQLESLAGSDYEIDLNQGMDARLFNEHIADICASIKWIRYVRFSCDTYFQVEYIKNAINLLVERGIKPYRVHVYLLITENIDDAAARVDALRHYKGIRLYAQSEINAKNGIMPNEIQRDFAHRYVRTSLYRKESWSEYRLHRKLKGLRGGG